MSLYSVQTFLFFPIFKFTSKSFNCPAIARFCMRMGRQANGGPSLHNGHWGGCSVKPKFHMKQSPE